MRAGQSYFRAEQERIRAESETRKSVARFSIAILLLIWLGIVGFGAKIAAVAIATPFSNAVQQIHFVTR